MFIFRTCGKCNRDAVCHVWNSPVSPSFVGMKGKTGVVTTSTYGYALMTKWHRLLYHMTAVYCHRTAAVKCFSTRCQYKPNYLPSVFGQTSLSASLPSDSWDEKGMYLCQRFGKQICSCSVCSSNPHTSLVRRGECKEDEGFGCCLVAENRCYIIVYIHLCEPVGYYNLL